VINPKNDPSVADAAQALYDELNAAGIDAVLDDRGLRPGAMFADIELIGIPHRVVVSGRGLEAGTFEYRARNAADSENLDRAALLARLAGGLKQASGSHHGFPTSCRTGRDDRSLEVRVPPGSSPTWPCARSFRTRRLARIPGRFTVRRCPRMAFFPVRRLDAGIHLGERWVSMRTGRQERGPGRL
jgi:hypothetical protein